MVGRQVDRPDRPEEIGKNDVLLRLGACAQLDPRAAPFEQHRRGVRVEVLERLHLDRAVAAERGEPLRLVQRLGVAPRNLEHDLTPVRVGSRRDP